MRKIHKYLGLILFPVIILMVISGVVLNHRQLFSSCDVSRAFLPDHYEYKNWNFGFFKGGIPLDSCTLLMYGNEGIWIADKDSSISEFDKGIDRAADQKKIHRIVRTSNKQFYAVSSYHLYHLDLEKKQWNKIQMPESEDMFVNLEAKADTLIVLSRSNFYIGFVGDNYEQPNFKIHTLAPESKAKNKHSLFRAVWDLHSGALWGLPGKLFVDCIGLLFLFISFSGFMIWFYKKKIKKDRGNNKNVKSARDRFLWYNKYHDKCGYWLLIPFIIITVTGAFLRPPLLLMIVNKTISPVPGTNMTSENKWKDLLRTIRYDEYNKSWLIYTSDGMYEFDSLEHPTKISKLVTPPISVMGLNIMTQINNNEWIIGSFSGLYIWNKVSKTYFDALKDTRYDNSSNDMPRGMPFSNNQISGLVFYDENKTVIFDYNKGAEVIEAGQHFIKMPEKYKNRPMSLWNLALEVHTGRIVTFLGMFTLLIPCILGIVVLLILVSGWKISKLKFFIRRMRQKKTVVSQTHNGVHPPKK